MLSYIRTPEENVFYYYKNSLLKNLVKVLKATNRFVIDEKKWEAFDKFIRKLEGADIQLMSSRPTEITGNNLYLYQVNDEIFYELKTDKGIIRDQIYSSNFLFFDTLLAILKDENPHTIPLDAEIKEEVVRITSERGHTQLEVYSDKFLYDMNDFIANAQASHPIFAELYNSFKEKLKLLFLETIKKRIEKIDKTIDIKLNEFLDPDNTQKNLSESAKFIGDSSTVKNFLALDVKNVIIDPKLNEFVHSNNNQVFNMLLQSQALTLYKTCLELDQKNIDVEIANLDKQINSQLDAVTHEKLLIKKVVLENVKDVFLKLLPDIFNPNNPLLHLISLMRYFEAILANFKTEYHYIEDIGIKHKAMRNAFLEFFIVVDTQKSRNKDGKIDDDTVDRLGRDLIITALVQALVSMNNLSHRATFNERIHNLPHKNAKIYKDINIDTLTEKLKKIITFYQYSTIEQRIKTLQVGIEAMEAKSTGVLEDAIVKVADNLNKQLVEKESKPISLKKSNTEFSTTPKVRSKKDKKRSIKINKIERSSSEFISEKSIPTERKEITTETGSTITITNRKSKMTHKKKLSSRYVPSPLLKSASNFDGDFNKFPFWEEEKNPRKIKIEPSQKKKTAFNK